MISVFRTSIFLLSLVFLVVSSSHVTAADDDKPQIFINSASGIGFVSGTNLGMTRFAQIARAKGFDIDQGVHSDLVSGSPLDGIDVYLFMEPNIPFTDQDKIALRQWVRAGGILITTDWQNGSKISGFTEEFGVVFESFKYSTRSILFAQNSPLSGPLNISSAWTRYSRDLTITDASKSEAILDYDDSTVAVSRTIANAGKGEIIVFSCMALLFDNAVGGDIGSADNDKLVQNLLSYIKTKFSNTAENGYDLSLLKVKFKRGTVFVPGEEIKMIARIRNIGTVISEDTRVAFYIERVGVATSTIIEVTSATVPAINAKKKIKIVKKTFLPNDLEASNYVIHAIIDPDGTTADGNTINNRDTARKLIIVQ